MTDIILLLILTTMTFLLYLALVQIALRSWMLQERSRLGTLTVGWLVFGGTASMAFLAWGDRWLDLIRSW